MIAYALDSLKETSSFNADPMNDFEEERPNHDETFILKSPMNSRVARKVLSEKVSNEENISVSNSHCTLPPCGCKMKKCNEKIEENTRKIINEKYWELDDYARRQWVKTHVNFNETKRRYSTEKEVRKRKGSRYFFLPITSQGKLTRIAVCQKTFLGTLGYSSDEVLRTSQNSTGEGNVIQKSKRET